MIARTPRVRQTVKDQGPLIYLRYLLNNSAPRREERKMLQKTARSVIDKARMNALNMPAKMSE